MAEIYQKRTRTTMVNIIAAIDRNMVIGNNGKLPWHLPADLKHFKALTTDNVVVMGRKTFDSIGKPLPRRTNIVLTRDKTFRHDGVLVCYNHNDILTLNNNIFIIGGGDIYQLFMPHVHRLYITHVQTVVKGDVYFPAIPQHFSIKEIQSVPSDEVNMYDMDFCVYEKP